MLGRRLAASSTRPQLTAGWPALQQAGSSWSGYSSAAAAATASAASEPTTPEQLRQAFSYCVSQVKKHDYENYLWVTQLPKVGLVRRRACAPAACQTRGGMSTGRHPSATCTPLLPPAGVTPPPPAAGAARPHLCAAGIQR